MANTDRREFLRRATMYGGGAVFAPSLQGLTALSSAVPPGTDSRPQALPGSGSYGPLVPAGPELALPEGFRYVRFGVEGSRMSDGNPTPRAHDGMAAFPLPNGRIRLVRNHEDREVAATARAVGDAGSAYDPRAGGGTTTLEVRVRPDGVPELVRDFVSLNGTVANCAGGLTPWGSWLTCEETTEGETLGRARAHGYIFEVSATADGPSEPVPLRAMGRFVHEAVAVDPRTGIVYETEDRKTSGFYRFIPRERGRLARGGRLQMLAIRGLSHHITTNGQTVGVPMPAVWVDIDDPDPSSAEQNPLAVFAQGYGKGGALFSRLEGCWYGDGSIYFDATDGGNAESGQIWQYRPTSDDDGELTLIYESPGPLVLDSPDNICTSPRGGLVICEDTRGAYVRGLTREGRIFDFAKNIANETEFAGACFSPDGRTLFVNLQGNTYGDSDVPGMTLAIWGPWERGAL